MEYKDYYDILGLKKDAPQDEIKRVYRKLARKYHPDVSKEKDAETKFKEVGEAYEVLKDPEKREAYDQLGDNWQAGQDGFQPPPDWSRISTLAVEVIRRAMPKITVAFLRIYLVVIVPAAVVILVLVDKAQDSRLRVKMSEPRS